MWSGASHSLAQWLRVLYCTTEMLFFLPLSVTLFPSMYFDAFDWWPLCFYPLLFCTSVIPGVGWDRVCIGNWVLDVFEYWVRSMQDHFNLCIIIFIIITVSYISLVFFHLYCLFAIIRTYTHVLSLSIGSVVTGRDREIRGATHNWPSVGISFSHRAPATPVHANQGCQVLRHIGAAGFRVGCALC